MSDELIHEWFEGNVAAYVAGGLSVEERARVVGHAAVCGVCAGLLAEVMAGDEGLRALFAEGRVGEGFEDRVVKGWRDASGRKMVIRPTMWRFAGGIAAAVMLGFIGYWGEGKVKGGGMSAMRFPSVGGLIGNRGSTGEGVTAASGLNRSREESLRTLANDFIADEVSVQHGDRRFVTYADGLQDSANLPVLNAWQTVDGEKGGAATWRFQTGRASDGGNAAGNGRAAGVSLGDSPARGREDVKKENEAVTKRGWEELQKGVKTGLGLEAKDGPVVALQAKVANTDLYTVQAGKEVEGEKHGAIENFYRTPTQGLNAHALYYKPAQGAIATEELGEKPVVLGRKLARGEDQAEKAKSDIVVQHFDTKAFMDGQDELKGGEGKVSQEVSKAGVEVAQGGDAKLRELQVQDLVEKVPQFGEVPSPTKFGRGDSIALADGTTPAGGAGVVAQQAAATGAATKPADVRKIIRNGTMDFEVDSFDSAAMQVSKIVGEEGGYVSSTDSEKLANGKVKGTIALRVPPERLDVLVLKLRALGDLKAQKIAAQDVTKQYSDLEGQLKAARTMEERLLEIIKGGKGEVKDLVEAEKQLGIYREKIEAVEGELRYYNNLVSLSTLNVTLFERDIKTPTAAFETEEVNAGVETEDVDKARVEALKAIEGAKGRVIESTMKNHGAGQYEARIVAEVSPENAGPVLDRLKQLGRVARLDVDRKQQTTGGSGAPAAGLKLERKATRFLIALYNLANVEPRETVNVALAAGNVEEAYKKILTAATAEEEAGSGRVVSRTLNGQKVDQTTASLVIEVKSERADAMEQLIRGAGEPMNVSVAENPDQANVTRAKRKFSVTIGAVSQVEPRETQTIIARARDVQGTYAKLLERVGKMASDKSAVRIRQSQLNEQDRQNVSGTLDVDVPRGELAGLLAILSDGKETDVATRNVTRSSDAANTLDSKVRLSLTVVGADQGPARETTRLAVEVSDVDGALNAAAAAATANGGRVVERRETKQPSGEVSGHVVIEVPVNNGAAVADSLVRLGTVRERESGKNQAVPEGALARAQFDVRVMQPAPVVGANKGIGASLREGWAVSLGGLLFSLQLLVVGVFLVGPFAAAAWGIWRLVRRGRRVVKG